MTANGCVYLRPASLEEATAALAAEPSGRPIAGGTDLVSEIAEGIASPTLLVELRHFNELQGIEETRDGGLSIGATTTLTDLHRHPLIRQRYPVLAQAALSVGTTQLRNQGTLGGNLCQRPRCWYYRNPLFQCLKRGGEVCYAATGGNKYHAIFGGEPCFIVHPSDCAPALGALDARLLLAGPQGSLEVDLSDFFVLPRESPLRENRLSSGEVVTRIILPPPAMPPRSGYLKFRERAWDFALVSVAASLTMHDGQCGDVRIVLGGVAPIPWRVPAAEKALRGQTLSDSAIAEAAHLATQGATPLEANRYKITLVRTLVRRCLAMLAD